jgi:hypothetical protein
VKRWDNTGVCVIRTKSWARTSGTPSIHESGSITSPGGNKSTSDQQLRDRPPDNSEFIFLEEIEVFELQDQLFGQKISLAIHSREKSIEKIPGNHELNLTDEFNQIYLEIVLLNNY